MRLAKRSQCPKCKQKWAIVLLDWSPHIRGLGVYGCKFCDKPKEKK